MRGCLTYENVEVEDRMRENSPFISPCLLALSAFTGVSFFLYFYYFTYEIREYG